MEKHLTQRQERYCQERAAGLTQRAAYRAAYPRSQGWNDASVDKAASRLEQSAHVLPRYRELADDAAKAAAKRAAWTRERSMRVRLDKLERGEDAAQAIAQATNGLRVDRDAEAVIDNAARDLDRLARLDGPDPDIEGGEVGGLADGDDPLIYVNIGKEYLYLHRTILDGTQATFPIVGGRGSLKSSFVALELCRDLKHNADHNAIVLMRWKEYIRDSAYEQVVWALDRLDMADDWQCSTSPMRCRNRRTGQVVVFRGCDDPKKTTKSIKPPHGYFAVMWLEEFDQFNGPDQLRTVRQSVTRGGEDFLRFYTCNPPRSTRHWANAWLAEQAALGIPVTRTSYLDAPRDWLGDQFLADAEELKACNRPAYDNEYGGIVTGEGGNVFENVVVRRVTPDEREGFGRISTGVDWGYWPDPWVCVRIAYDSAQRRLWIYREDRSVRETNEQTAARVRAMQEADRYAGEVWCDSAERKSTRAYQDLGIDARNAPKGPGSVEQGYLWMARLREIVIDPSCELAAREFQGYEFQQLRTGEYTSSLPDRDNHSIDAVHYACAPFIRES